MVFDASILIFMVGSSAKPANSCRAPFLVSHYDAMYLGGLLLFAIIKTNVVPLEAMNANLNTNYIHVCGRMVRRYSTCRRRSLPSGVVLNLLVSTRFPAFVNRSSCSR